MRNLFALAICFLALIAVGQALECYTGWAIIRGRSVGTTTEVCKKDSDSCYRMSSDINTAIKAKLAGCSTYRCMLTRNTCLGQGDFGHRNEICCCNQDRCNANQEKSATDKVRGVLDAISAGKK
ncbi:hypothetical protein M3Y97_00657000 [Aphelenchoides bicaudatus]|nr:hypothetical protein M3Y97_00657000 [Aphelenchoides bicaudatus]